MGARAPESSARGPQRVVVVVVVVLEVGGSNPVVSGPAAAAAARTAAVKAAAAPPRIPTVSDGPPRGTSRDTAVSEPAARFDPRRSPRVSCASARP